MRRSIRSLNAGCKSLKFILEETLGQGPELEEARALLRSLYYVAKDAIIAEGDRADHYVDEYNAAYTKAMGDRLFFEPESDSPTIRGTLTTVGEIERLLDDGWDCAEILSTHAELDVDDIEACVNYIEFSKLYHVAYGEKVAA